VSHDVVRRIIANVENAVLGKQQTIKLSVVALLAGGHILLEDAPGLGKTSLARALSKTLGCKFVRMQFTPDLLPSDILGSSVYRPGTSDLNSVRAQSSRIFCWLTKSIGPRPGTRVHCWRR